MEQNIASKKYRIMSKCSCEHGLRLRLLLASGISYILCELPAPSWIPEGAPFL